MIIVFHDNGVINKMVGTSIIAAISWPSPMISQLAFLEDCKLGCFSINIYIAKQIIFVQTIHYIYEAHVYIHTLPSCLASATRYCSVTPGSGRSPSLWSKV